MIPTIQEMRDYLYLDCDFQPYELGMMTDSQVQEVYNDCVGVIYS